jgi:hypothetical protein
MVTLLAQMPRQPNQDGPRITAGTRLSARTLAILTDYAKSEKRTLSQVIEFACDAFAEQVEAKGKPRKPAQR